jgi:hypothetical protein
VPTPLLDERSVVPALRVFSGLVRLPPRCRWNLASAPLPDAMAVRFPPYREAVKARRVRGGVRAAAAGGHDAASAGPGCASVRCGDENTHPHTHAPRSGHRPKAQSHSHGRDPRAAALRLSKKKRAGSPSTHSKYTAADGRDQRC